jgi:formylglycine-generating enzyme required for sulfatase activity
LEQITELDPKPPRQWNDSIDRELERICLKLLAKRKSDRFSSAKDLIDDLQAFRNCHSPASDSISQVLTPQPRSGPAVVDTAIAAPNKTPIAITPPSGSKPLRIVPKGLRSFDRHDADFFLELLPGPRDRNGLPDTIGFWKTRIEERDSQQTFSVGLIYGPSGCGKSSMVKAGLLPRLPKEILAIYLEATTDQTEVMLLGLLRQRLEAAGAKFDPSMNLVGLLSAIRRGRVVPSSHKVLLVLDQFEQWLHAHTQSTGSELIDALSQCDGSHLQTIVMVRDDFWMAATRFFRDLDIRLLEGHNSAAVDLFDLDHAERVLKAFGRAFNKLDANDEDEKSDRKEFVIESLRGLAEEGKVISVRLSLFAEMMKGRPWTPESLKEVGGTAGVGATFLEETFSASGAPPEHRYHQAAARAVLQSLLPEGGTEIKGHRRSQEELLAASGYTGRARDFQDLIRILDNELRLITPVDTSESRTIVHDRSSAETSGDNAERLGQPLYYQLTHDYLVPSLRDWLTRKQRETKKGRAELKLAERAAVWSAKPENKQLPTLWEWISIRRLTDKKRWTTSERSLMRTAARVHFKHWGFSILAMLILGSVLGYLFQQQNLRNQREKIAVALDSLQKTLGPAVPVNVDKLIEMKRPDLIRSELDRRYAATSEAREKLSLAFALASFGQVESDYLISQLDSIEDRDTTNLIKALGHDTAGSIDKLRQAAKECTTQEQYRRKARLALAALAIGDTVLPTDACEFEGRTDHGVRTWFIDEFRRWELDREALITTVRDSTSPALRSAVCLGLGQIPAKQISAEEKTRIAELATKWYSLPDSLTHSAVAWLMRQWERPEPTLPDAKQMVAGRNWFVNSQGVTFVRITPSPVEPKPLPDPLEPYRQRLSEIEKLMPAERDKPEIRFERGQGLYVLSDYEAALAEFDTILKMQLDDSMKALRTECQGFRPLVLARLKRTEEAEAALTEWLSSEPSDSSRLYKESVVLLWLGRKAEAIERLENGLAIAESADRETRFVLARTLARFAADVSAMAEEKRKWSDRAIAILQGWSDGDEADRNQLRSDTSFLVLHSNPQFVKLASERPNVPEHPYWLANREVTRGEFEAFLNDTNFEGEKPTDSKQATPEESVSPTPDHPAQNVSWYDAVMYCNWLSRNEGRTPAYRNVGKEKIKTYDDQEEEVDKWELDASANGYRLPNEVEWEYACRSGSETDWSPGSDESLLSSYCQMYPSKLASPCGKKLPNAWGLHDMHGNVWEWCWDLTDQLGSLRVYRGGCWSGVAAFCGSAIRSRDYPSYRFSIHGFRVALSSPSGIPK